MAYIGNLPEFNIVNTHSDRYDYVFASSPTISINPSSVYATWLKTATCELFICKDNTPDSNVWVGQLGTDVP